MLVYCINREGKPLMPCRPQKARKLLKEGKAQVIRKTPFTVKLLYGSTGYRQPVVAGMDTGSVKIGCTAVANGRVVYQSEVHLRNDVHKKMLRRKQYRRSRRSRKTRYRSARWRNRASMYSEDRLAPSIRSKVESHLREKAFVESILPVTKWRLELASFDIHKITNPDVTGKGYQEGPQLGYYNVRAYVLHRDSYRCRHCRGKSKDKRLRVHHVVFRSQGGTDEPDNLLTLCCTCHDQLHDGLIELKQKSRRSRTKHATEIGIVKSQLKKRFGAFEETFGYRTKWKREQLGLPKQHYYDAVAICLRNNEGVVLSSVICYKRHVAAGDYQQTRGRRSEIRIPTSKLFGLRKFDLIKTTKGIGLVKGKRGTGFFALSQIDGTKVHAAVNVKQNCSRLQARSTVLVDRRDLPGLKSGGFTPEDL